MARTYELMAIYRPEVTDEQARKEVDGVASSLAEAGASVVGTDYWGRRNLAYEIDKAREGHYAVVTFQGEPGHVSALDRSLSLSDAVLRHKIIRPDDTAAQAGEGIET